MDQKTPRRDPSYARTDFWRQRQEVNAQKAIYHQWDQLVASGCIENFRITASEKDGMRQGWFFADSDAYKWLDAASRIWATHSEPRLSALMDGFIDLLRRAQSPDGYLFTYNQIHFPGVRWQNLQIEHELYCHGHLIEAGVSHYKATGQTGMLTIARLAADRILEDFRGKKTAHTPGHEEIEIALIRLNHILGGSTPYLDLARQFIEQRGRNPFFAVSIFWQNLQVAARGKLVEQQKAEYVASHPGYTPFQLPPGNTAKGPPDASLRWQMNVLSGKYFQQHAPIRQQTVPVGHSVRFTYLETATAMLARETGDQTYLPALERAWEHMVTRRMYVTGGIGSLPRSEGFGRDYELDPEFAYAETCAALGSIFWNWEMARLTGEAKYSELLEWQLYNAAAVGMGLDGTTYLYNNPLTCRGGVTRQPWYAVPCCPSNLSRTWADVSKYTFSTEEGKIRVHQYLASELFNKIIVNGGSGGHTTISVALESALPWEGSASLKILDIASASPLEIQLRQPVWADRMEVAVNGAPFAHAAPQPTRSTTASGYDPRTSAFVPVSQAWKPGDVIEISLGMPVRLRRAHPKVKGHSGKVALTRGPLVYCLESIDNPEVDIFTTRLDPDSIVPVDDSSLLNGIVKLQASTIEGKPLIFIPYFLWGNRGASQMTVWVNA